MDIDRVRYFHVFSQVGSLVKASELLHISQPALSKALTLLQSEIGIQLLEQDGRGLRLTQAGLQFKTTTASLLQQWLDIPNQLAVASAVQPTRIGSFEVFTTHLMGHLVNYVDLEKLEVHSYGPGKIEEAIANNIIDVGITYAPVPKAGVEFIEVTKISMGVFGLAKFEKTEFSDLDFVIPLPPPEGMPSKAIGLDGWPDHEIGRKVKYKVAMMTTAIELVKKGLCVAYFPKFVIDLHNEDLVPQKRMVELKSGLSQKERMQSVYLMQRKGNSEGQLFRKMAKCLRSLK